MEQELRRIRSMPYGTARIAAAEQTARRLDAEGPREHLAEALLDLVEAYTFAGEGAKSFVVFARALRLWDESPELFDAGDERNLFWEFKWIASDLPEYPQISPAQAEAFLADMERRFEVAGHGTSTVRMSRFRWAWHTGAADAEAARLLWITGLRDEFEDCRACTIGQQVEYFTETGRWDEAVALGLTQDSSCNLEPTRTHHSVALAALLSGDSERAVASYRLARATLDGGEGDFSTEQGQAFELLARGGHLDRALRHLRADCPELLTDGASPLLRLRFLISVLAGLSANLDAASRETGLRRPHPGLETVGGLHAWVREEAERLASEFDARNGTAYYADAVVSALSATPCERALDFGGATGSVAVGPGDSGTAEAEAGAASGAGSAPGTPAPDTDAGHPARTDGDGDSPPAFVAADASGVDRFERAETLARLRAYSEAVREYAEASTAFAAEGWIARAGLAAAEAAQCASLDHDDAAAHRWFTRAVQLLRSGGGEAETLVAVLTAWAPVASRMDDPAPHATAVDAVLAEHGDPEEARADLAEALAERLAAERSRRRATLRDTLARAIASADPERLPGGLDTGRAISEALLAGTEYAQLGLIADAAHAFWLAGRLQRNEGDAAGAQWALESAFEGFTVAGRRDDRARAAGELIELLRATDQGALADRVTSQLTD
ncbi:hypothetical protein D3248_06080 [Leucobacter zeae]|nr:hypothetical protein [Leucobacter zeae]